MRVAPWMPEHFEFQQNYPGGQQAYEQGMHQTVQNWQNQQGGGRPTGPRGIMGLGNLFGQGGGGPGGFSGTPHGMSPSIQQPIDPNAVAVQDGPGSGYGGGWAQQPPNVQDILGWPRGAGVDDHPSSGWEQQQPTSAQPTTGIQSGLPLGVMANISQMPGQMTGFGEQMTGFGETLGGYKDLLSGFGEKFGSFGEKLGGFKDEFSGINDKLQNLEQGISSLTDKFGTQQQQQQQPQQNYMNPFGSINPYTPFFGGLGAFMRRY